MRRSVYELIALHTGFGRSTPGPLALPKRPACRASAHGAALSWSSVPACKAELRGAAARTSMLQCSSASQKRSQPYRKAHRCHGLADVRPEDCFRSQGDATFYHQHGVLMKHARRDTAVCILRRRQNLVKHLLCGALEQRAVKLQANSPAVQSTCTRKYVFAQQV